MHLRTVAIGTLAVLAAQNITHASSAATSTTIPIQEQAASNLTDFVKGIKLKGVESIATPETLKTPISAPDTSDRSKNPQIQADTDNRSAAAVPNSDEAIAPLFADEQGHPRQEFVAALQARGVLDEFENGSFAPDEMMTEADFAKLLRKTFRADLGNKGVLKDDAQSASKSNQPISRARVLVELAKELKLQATPENNFELDAYFEDASEIPEDLRNSLEAAIANHLISHQPDRPLPTLDGAVTKAEVADFIYRALVRTGEIAPEVADSTLQASAPAAAVAEPLSGSEAYRLPPIESNSTPAANFSPNEARAEAARISTRLDALRNSLQAYRSDAIELPPLGVPDTYLPQTPAIFNGYIWPAQGILTSGYGWRWGRMHKGIDVAGPIGTPIVAAAPGVVTYAGWDDGGYGILVEIQHPDGSITRYAHNNRLLVREGQQVEQGQQISEMGSTGNSTGPHLHFEIHPRGQGAADPMAYLHEGDRNFATYRQLGQGGR